MELTGQSRNSKTLIHDEAAKAALLGEHPISLQWIQFGKNDFGQAKVEEHDGVLTLKGGQKSKKDSDFLTVDGIITEINPRDFHFRGKIVVKVGYNNDGKPCERNGDFTFRITGARQFWRLKEMNSPCEAIVDYVDLHFAK
jgi:hypothetical protein